MLYTVASDKGDVSSSVRVPDITSCFSGGNSRRTTLKAPGKSSEHSSNRWLKIVKRCRKRFII